MMLLTNATISIYSGIMYNTVVDTGYSGIVLTDDVVETKKNQMPILNQFKL